jgi:hypothetical protein
MTNGTNGPSGDDQPEENQSGQADVDVDETNDDAGVEDNSEEES